MMINEAGVIEENSKKLDPLADESFVDTKIIETLKNSNFPNDEDELDFPPDDDIFEMVRDVNLNEPLPTVTERYFTTYYRINFPKEGDDICIRMHTNRLCMISLAPSHSIFQNDRKIEKIDFQVTEKLNRADNPVSGKAKHGAQPLHETSKICSITCTDGNTWIVRCGMNGKLTEANTDLLKNPELIRQPPHKGGYLAIVLPKINAIDQMKKYLMTREIYDEAIHDRSRTKIEHENSDGANSGAVKRPFDENEPTEHRDKVMKTKVQENEHKIMDEKIDSSILPCT